MHTKHKVHCCDLSADRPLNPHRCPQVSLSDLQKIQIDTVDVLWREIRGTASALLSSRPLSGTQRTLLEGLIAWDGDMSVRSRNASLYASWYAASCIEENNCRVRSEREREENAVS
jgi:hypothetical protein